MRYTGVYIGRRCTSKRIDGDERNSSNMDIEQIEIFLTKMLPGLAENENAPTDTILLTVQVQLLLHIYRKLDAIEDQLMLVNREFYK